VEQRYLSYQEYAERGYVLRQDVQFDTGSYSSFSLDLNPFDLAYRADTKEQYYRDAAQAIVEVGIAYVGGGVGRLVRTTYGVVKELVTND
tara:strand:- start:751 stop:1020 length:270 start_codon:yes stop_codon:yes gene_type:complete